MTIKKILMAAVAVTALTAGAANAASISNLTKVGDKYMVPDGVDTASTIFDAYAINNESDVVMLAKTATANLVAVSNLKRNTQSANGCFHETVFQTH